MFGHYNVGDIYNVPYEDIDDTGGYQCHRELCKLNAIGKEVYEVMLMCWAEEP